MDIYSRLFATRRVDSMWLRQRGNLNSVQDAGFRWVAPIHRRWAQTLRNETVGRPLLISTEYYCGAVEINSLQGRRLINRLCY
jgi:hypothetical protein